MVDLMVEEMVVAPVGGWNGGEREREGETAETRAVKAGFFFLDLIFSSPRSSMEPLFIGGGRG